MRIGVFDSGIGGEAVAISLRSSFPAAEVLRVSDLAHAPYGTRSPAQILRLTNKAIQPLLTADCDIIVIACNTATATALPQLREDYPDQLFIGLEPMIKPAAKLTATKSIAVFATPATLSSRSYKRLKLLYGAGVTIVEPDCGAWASLIEGNQMNKAYIASVIRQCHDQNVDVIVLACTHYHWIQREIQLAAGYGVAVIEPSQSIARRVAQLFDL